MEGRRKHLVLTWLAGFLSFVVSYCGLMGFAFSPWGNSLAQNIPGILMDTVLLFSFPTFLLFLRGRGLAVLLQWLAVIICIVSSDAQGWSRNAGIVAKLFAAFSPQDCVFIYPFIPAVFLTVLYWLKGPLKTIPQEISDQH